MKMCVFEKNFFIYYNIMVKISVTNLAYTHLQSLLHHQNISGQPHTITSHGSWATPKIKYINIISVFVSHSTLCGNNKIRNECSKRFYFVFIHFFAKFFINFDNLYFGTQNLKDVIYLRKISKKKTFSKFLKIVLGN